MLRKLHIGGKCRSQGWEVLNANPAPYVDHVCNANDLSQFDDDSFSEIYASHIVEHFDYVGELQSTLKEWFRVLQPSGKIYISVPDLDVLATLTLDKESLTAEERFHAMRMLFGGHTDKYDYHFVGLNEEFLTQYLQGAGYVNARRVEGFGLFEDTSSMVFKGVPISLNMIAEKQPATATVARAGDANKALYEGRWQEAIALYERCIEIEPEERSHYWKLGAALLSLGRGLEAQGTWFGVLMEAPEEAAADWNAELHETLVAVAAKLTEKKLLGEAERCLRQALELEASPINTALAHNCLGVALEKKGDIIGAIESYEAARDRNPQLTHAVYNLARLYMAQTLHAKALEGLKQALEIDPNYLPASIALGNLLQTQGNKEEALAVYQRVLAIDENQAPIQKIVGVMLLERQDYQGALAHFEKYIELDPNAPEGYFQLGCTLQNLDRSKAAIDAFLHAIRLRPSYKEAHYNLAVSLRSTFKLELQLQSNYAALAIDPSFAPPYYNISTVLAKQGRIAEALKYCRLSRGLAPDAELGYTQPLLIRLYRLEFEARETLTMARRWAEKFTPNTSQFSFANCDRTPERRLRIGYVSPDFRKHAVSNFLFSILSKHDPQAFEIFCYAEVRKPDEMTERLRELSHHWSSTVTRSDEEVAGEIYRDEIDILVDLAGHTEKSRLNVFGYKPAPVQITYLGYPSTTGLATMDYRLTDAWADPEGQGEDGYAEALVRLPGCFVCFTPPLESPDVAPAPAREKGYVTYGSFNNLSKVSPETIAAWAQILQAVPTARIFLKHFALTDEETCERFWEMFESCGIERERVELRGFIEEKTGHLDCYQEVDLALDTFPYNGTTTTCEAMWMGVPVVSLTGDRHLSRVGRSLLHAVGLEEFVTYTVEDYVAKAVALGRDPARLASIRSQLREQMAASMLCDASGHTQRLEATYRQLWSHWCQSMHSQ